MKHSQCLTPPPFFIDYCFPSKKIAVFELLNSISSQKYLMKRDGNMFYTYE